MLTPVAITSRTEYDYVRRLGYEPLLDKRFSVEINLRVEIQRELFGTGHSPEENEKFYRWCWAHKPHQCEETMRPLFQYSAVCVSHILTRGAHPEMAHDPRNVNILCFEMHNKWENGDRRSMRIYEKNQLTIRQLREEYGKI